VLAVNYKGDPTPLAQQYRLYPAFLAGDMHGLGRLSDIIRVEQPAVCLFVCDPWIGADYAKALSTIPDRPPCVLYTPVDATGLRKVDIAPLALFDQVIAYTQFGARELAKAGHVSPIAVIPHGIDLDLFRPIDQAEARRATGLPLDTFAVLILDQNNPRKRLDIAFDAFARFSQDKPETVKLVYHGPLGGANRWDILGMADDLGISDRLILPLRGGLPMDDAQLPYLYSMCDVKLSTTSGEGWGLTTMEAMACGVPCIAPDFAALGEWAEGAVEYIPAVTPLRHVEINTVGRSPRAEDAASVLRYLYTNKEARMDLRVAGYARVRRQAYQWPRIADQFDAVLQTVASGRALVPAAREEQAVLA